VRRRFLLNQDDIGAGSGKRFNEILRRRDHQMRFQWQTRNGSQTSYQDASKRNIGHEASVHHIDVNTIRPSSLRSAYFLPQACEIRREDGWSDFDLQSDLPGLRLRQRAASWSRNQLTRPLTGWTF